jgi:polyhydroxyalkanoate synthase
MIRWLTEQGFTVFLVSWVNPGPELKDKTFSDYMHQGVYEAVAQVLKQAGTKQLNAVGYCIAGTLLGSTLGPHGGQGDKRIASPPSSPPSRTSARPATCCCSPTTSGWDAGEEDGRAGGVLPGAAMAETFNALRANDLVWSFFVNNYLMGKDPAAFDLLFWNSDQTRMPKTLHMFYLRNFYRDNKLTKGELEVDGVTLDLGKVKTPVYAQSSREDHIAPFRSIYKGVSRFGGPVTFTMAGSGHIAGVVNHPSAAKYQHWTNDALPETVEAWQADAWSTRAPGGRTG